MVYNSSLWKFSNGKGARALPRVASAQCRVRAVAQYTPARSSCCVFVVISVKQSSFHLFEQFVVFKLKSTHDIVKSDSYEFILHCSARTPEQTSDGCFQLATISMCSASLPTTFSSQSEGISLRNDSGHSHSSVRVYPSCRRRFQEVPHYLFRGTHV